MSTTRVVNLIPITALLRLSKSGELHLDMLDHINTPPGINQIVVSLVTEGLDGSPATFATSPPGPLIWLDASGRVIDPPSSFQVVAGEQQLTIWDANATCFETAHRFWLVIQYQGRTFYQDPTIINQKPVQPDPPAR
jgi:hypothetical protein